MFFSKKYTVTFLNSKWEIVKSKIKLNVIPQKGEYVYMNNRYYDVLNLIHSIDNQHNIHIVVEESQIKFEVNLISNKKN